MSDPLLWTSYRIALAAETLVCRKTRDGRCTVCRRRVEACIATIKPGVIAAGGKRCELAWLRAQLAELASLEFRRKCRLWFTRERSAA